MVDKSQQEMMIKLSMFEQQINQLQQQIQVVEQGIGELQSLSLGLDDLKSGKDKEIMAGIGKGIFVKAKVVDEDLTIDVGGKNFVKKSIGDTQKMIDDQVEKLVEVKGELEDNLEKVGEEVNRVMGDGGK